MDGLHHAHRGNMPMTVSAFDYSADVVLKDGSTVHLRPIRPDDDVRLLELLQRMSEEALYYRFLAVPKIDRERARELTRVAPDRQRVLFRSEERRVGKE